MRQTGNKFIAQGRCNLQVHCTRQKWVCQPWGGAAMTAATIVYNIIICTSSVKVHPTTLAIYMYLF